MRINYNVTGPKRKALVAAISQELNAPTNYLGTPTFAYEVGGYHIDKNGTVTGKDNLELEEALDQKGFSVEKRGYGEHDTYESGMGATPSIEDLKDEAELWAESEMHRLKLENTNVLGYSNRGRYGGDDTLAFEELGFGKEYHEDFQGENGMQADDCPETFAVEIPKSGLMDAQVQNILKLIESKRMLLTKALGRPLTVNDKGETLQFLYPYSEEVGVGIIYSQLSTAFVDYAKKRQRVTAAEREVESEKFAMRTFLVRLGMNGGEFSVVRKWLCRNLSGNASFSNGASYAAMQASRRNGGQTDEQK